MISATDEQIRDLSTKLTREMSKHTLKLKDKIIKDELKMLYNKFIIVPICKASSNFAFICQRHYAQAFINKLGLNTVNNIASTYIKSIKPVEIKPIRNLFNKNIDCLLTKQL